MLLLSDTEFLFYCRQSGKPFPASLSSLRKDRSDARLGGIPFREFGGRCLYNPENVWAWMSGIPITQPVRHPALQKQENSKLKRGKPLKTETIEASRRGITVPELRAQKILATGDASHE